MREQDTGAYKAFGDIIISMPANLQGLWNNSIANVMISE